MSAPLSDELLSSVEMASAAASACGSVLMDKETFWGSDVRACRKDYMLAAAICEFGSTGCARDRVMVRNMPLRWHARCPSTFKTTELKALGSDAQKTEICHSSSSSAVNAKTT